MVLARKATAEFVDECMVESGADETQRMLAFMWFDARENVVTANLGVQDVKKPDFCKANLPCREKRDCIELNKLLDDSNGALGSAGERMTLQNYVHLVSFDTSEICVIQLNVTFMSYDVLLCSFQQNILLLTYSVLHAEKISHGHPRRCIPRQEYPGPTEPTSNCVG